MLSEKIIRAWKDVEYRLSLSEVERAQLPDHPAGLVELTEQELSPVGGGVYVTSGPFCVNHTKNSFCHCVQ
jgi:mersacidin/lichenicidin family type 2 lantibiotic